MPRGKDRHAHRSCSCCIAITTTHRATYSASILKIIRLAGPDILCIVAGILISRRRELWRRPGICASRFPAVWIESSLSRAVAIAILSGTSFQLRAAGGRADALHHRICVFFAVAITAVIVIFFFKFHRKQANASVLPSRRFAARGRVDYRSTDSGDGHVRLGCVVYVDIAHAAGHAGCLRDRQAVDVEGAAAQRNQENQMNCTFPWRNVRLVLASEDVIQTFRSAFA